MTDLEFSFEGITVGVFEEDAYPRRPGLFHYVPYRGAGHWQMQQALESTGQARCHFDTPEGRVFFLVLDCPDYGVLEADHFESEDKAPTQP